MDAASDGSVDASVANDDVESIASDPAIDPPPPLPLPLRLLDALSSLRASSSAATFAASAAADASSHAATAAASAPEGSLGVHNPLRSRASYAAAVSAASSSSLALSVDARRGVVALESSFDSSPALPQHPPASSRSSRSPPRFGERVGDRVGSSENTLRSTVACIASVGVPPPSTSFTSTRDDDDDDDDRPPRIEFPLENMDLLIARIHRSRSSVFPARKMRSSYPCVFQQNPYRRSHTSTLSIPRRRSEFFGCVTSSSANAVSPSSGLALALRTVP